MSLLALPVKWYIIQQVRDSMATLTCLERVRKNPSLGIDGGTEPYCNVFYDPDKKARKNQLVEASFRLHLETYYSGEDDDSRELFFTKLFADTAIALLPQGAAIYNYATAISEDLSDFFLTEPGKAISVHWFDIRYLHVFGNPYDDGK